MIFKDNFLEKNLNITTKSINAISQSLGIGSIKGSHNKLNGKSTTFILKTGTDDLIKKLNETVSKGDDKFERNIF